MALALPHEVFLSHSSQDLAFVDVRATKMRRHGVPVWYSRTNIIGAQQWHDEIGAALQRCDWFAVVLSPESVGSMWVKREVLKALEPRRLENRIIPILFQPCDFEHLSWTPVVLSNDRFYWDVRGWLTETPKDLGDWL